MLPTLLRHHLFLRPYRPSHAEGSPLQKVWNVVCRPDLQGSAPQEAGTSAPGEWLVFEVTDTGCGIAKEGLHALFNDFVQVHHISGGDTCPVGHQGQCCGIHADAMAGVQRARWKWYGRDLLTCRELHTSCRDAFLP